MAGRSSYARELKLAIPAQIEAGTSIVQDARENWPLKTLPATHLILPMEGFPTLEAQRPCPSGRPWAEMDVAFPVLGWRVSPAPLDRRLCLWTSVQGREQRGESGQGVGV